MKSTRSLRQSTTSEPVSPIRLKVLLAMIYCLLAAVSTRLFYWQVIKSQQLQVEASAQYLQTIKTEGQRGSIFTSDGFALVSNEQVYRVFVEPPQLEVAKSEIATRITPYLLNDLRSYQQATEAADKTQLEADLRKNLEERMSKPDAKWVALFNPVSERTKHSLSELKIKGLGFEPYFQRAYPEASMAAQVAGILGRTDDGQEIGYFGVEGSLDKELKGRSEQSVQQTDALGLKLLGQSHANTKLYDGRDVVLTIRRDVQHLAETYLKQGMERYGARAGEILIMDPTTGKILAMASYPNYDPKFFSEYPAELYKNPAVSSTYEPGSTFKTLTVAAGIDAGVIKEDTQCPSCEGPKQIGKYSLKTWNDQYNPNITMTEALAKSDNTAMIYIAELLGADTFQKYIKAFGIGEKTQVELQEDVAAPYPGKWGEVELATRSFGQGISTTSLQMVKAISAIANHGIMMKPTLIEKVIDRNTHQEIVVNPQVERPVIMPETAETVTRMMVYAAQQGEAKWVSSKTNAVAAKTGTSQIPGEGGYLADKTIASFVGFAPPGNPKFIMMVKLVEPTTSPWASETAAPLWYQIAEKLYLLLNIPPDRS